MRTKILKELKNSFTPYAPFWEAWKVNQSNGLSATDIYIIEVQIVNDFIIDINDFVMFYNEPGRLIKLEEKLKKNYSAFQNWLVSKFRVAVICLANEIPVELFLRIPFNVFGKLTGHYKTISPDLIKVLQKFNSDSIGNLFTIYSDNDFKDKDKFSIVVEFLVTIEIKQVINRSLSKEIKNQSKNYAVS